MENKKLKRLQLTIGIVVLVLMIIFIGQNWQPIPVNFLGIRIVGNAFLVFICIFLIGLGLGYFWGKLRRKTSLPADNPEPHKLET